MKDEILFFMNDKHPYKMPVTFKMAVTKDSFILMTVMI